MKTTILLAIMAGTTLTTLSLPTARADDSTTNSAPVAPGATGASTDDGKAQKIEKFKEALDELNLSDVQRTKIKDILQNEPKSRDRRQHIMAVLTPDQKAKLKKMIQERRAANGT